MLAPGLVSKCFLRAHDDFSTRKGISRRETQVQCNQRGREEQDPTRGLDPPGLSLFSEITGRSSPIARRALPLAATA